jgi:hypothetical protein
MADKAEEEGGSIIGVDVNPAPAAHQLTQAGWAGITLVFLSLMVLMWRHFWKKIAQLEESLNTQQKEFNEERKEFGKLLDGRHQQFIAILQNSNTTMASATETSRQEIALITAANELLRRVNRSIGRCERAQAQPLREEDVDNG